MFLAAEEKAYVLNKASHDARANKAIPLEVPFYLALVPGLLSRARPSSMIDCTATFFSLNLYMYFLRIYVTSQFLP